MKIINYDNGAKSYLKAFKVNIKGKEHYNILLGTRGHSGWEYRISVDDTIIQNNLEENSILLDGDYTLIPVIKNGKHSVDKEGNRFYYITNSNRINDRDILLVVWHNREDDIKSTTGTIIGRGRYLNLDTITYITVILLKDNDEIKLRENDKWKLLINRAGEL